MLPATLVTLLSFLLNLSNSSPVYNMQPAFITTNIGSTNGRNIRNLPCVSRKNSELSGVCMFAIDCLKANGTHLGTCIDRFYFGSCCHIEPIKEIIIGAVNNTDVVNNMPVLDNREPPERIHNTTAMLGSTKPPTIVSHKTTTIGPSTTHKYTTMKYPSTKRPLSTKKPSLSSKPLPTKPHPQPTRFSTTTPKPFSTSITRRPTAPVKTSTKLPSTITKPRPAITAPERPFVKPSTPITSRPTAKPTKPVKFSSTSRKPPLTTATRKPTTTEKVITTRPTRRVTKPTSAYTTAKPSLTSQTTRTTTTMTTRKSTVSSSTTPIASSTTTTKTSTASTTLTTQFTKLPELSSTTRIPPTSTLYVPSSTTASTIKPATSTQFSTEEPISKKNITQIYESNTANPSSNEVESGGLAILINNTVIGSDAVTLGTTSAGYTSTVFVATTLLPPVSNSLTSSTSIPSTTSSTTPTSTTTASIIHYNQTSTTEINDKFTTVGNITEDWVPITTPDGWVLLPSVTPLLPLANETEISSTMASLNATADPTVTLPPKITSENPLTTSTAETTSAQSIEITTGSSSENFTTATEVFGNITTMEAPTSPESTGVVITTEQATSKPVNMSDFTDVCGRRMWPEARIVGGQKSTFGKWPWQISLRQWRTSTYLHKCGAALLNENWAITAAHCVDNVPPSDLLLRLGEHDLSSENKPYLHEERRVQIVASHPQFDPRTFEYDLALLRFYEPVQFQPNILPVCVPTTDDNFVGRTAHVTGWGRLYEDGPLPSVLQEVSVPVINNTLCESMYKSAGYIEHIPHIFICAGWKKGGFDSCEGDSGGPMVIQRDDKRFLLAGVISWGIGCAEPNQPGIYTRISEFRDWINQILQF